MKLSFCLNETIGTCSLNEWYKAIEKIGVVVPSLEVSYKEPFFTSKIFFISQKIKSYFSLFHYYFQFVSPVFKCVFRI